MAIIRMWHKPLNVVGPYTPLLPEGAFSYAYKGGPMSEKNHVTVYNDYVGLCLYAWERNGYDDSDFYMTVWDEKNQKPLDILYATTRGWTYPCYGSKADATPEVRAKFDAYQEARRREHEEYLAQKAEDERQEREAANAELAAIVGCTADRVQALRDAHGPDMFPALATLLKTRKFRSTFRASIADQVKAWLLDPAPKYARPLSPKQAQYI